MPFDETAFSIYSACNYLDIVPKAEYVENELLTYNINDYKTKQ